MKEKKTKSSQKKAKPLLITLIKIKKIQEVCTKQTRFFTPKNAYSDWYIDKLKEIILFKTKQATQKKANKPILTCFVFHLLKELRLHALLVFAFGIRFWVEATNQRIARPFKKPEALHFTCFWKWKRELSWYVIFYPLNWHTIRNRQSF